MNWEIEIKAWVDDPGALRKQIERLGARSTGRYDKQDEYYRISPSGKARDEGREFRLRVDGSRATVTFKDKSIRDGLEMNREGEFRVDDPGVFREFIQRMGARLRIRKRKRGEAFAYGRVLLELSEVEGLGHFIELESVFQEHAQIDDPAFIQKTEVELFSLLKELGISRDRVESRPYTQMLREVLEAGES